VIDFIDLIYKKTKRGLCLVQQPRYSYCFTNFLNRAIPTTLLKNSKHPNYFPTKRLFFLANHFAKQTKRYLHRYFNNPLPADEAIFVTVKYPAPHKYQTLQGINIPAGSYLFIVIEFEIFIYIPDHILVLDLSFLQLDRHQEIQECISLFKLI
jgi:hypothetical protein